MQRLKNVEIFLCEDMPFIGGSSDGIVTCSCCGKFWLEVKCPFSIRDKSPLDLDVKLPYINREIGGTMKLNKNRRYYTQCQIQMAASQIRDSYFRLGASWPLC